MLMVLSPAKSLDYNPIELELNSQPRFKEQSTELAEILKEKSAAFVCILDAYLQAHFSNYMR